ncbi:MAG: hypothetical protein JW908_02570 [Anaerolineales bacterium]|nr:hypothetical protein [Anaerolineales bacterium]
MSNKISLKEAERQVFSSAMQDGLWDILIGCFISEFAIAPLLSQRLGDFWSSAVFLPFWCLVYLAIFWIRKNIIKPRLGEVTFGKMRRMRLVKLSITLLIVNLIAFLLGIIFYIKFVDIQQHAPLAILGIILLVILSFLAYILDFYRFYVYALLAGFSPIIGEWLYINYGASHHGFPITFGITTGIIIVTGAIIFFRLLSNNPVINLEATQNDQPIA